MVKEQDPKKQRLYIHFDMGTECEERDIYLVDLMPVIESMELQGWEFKLRSVSTDKQDVDKFRLIFERTPKAK